MKRDVPPMRIKTNAVLTLTRSTILFDFPCCFAEGFSTFFISFCLSINDQSIPRKHFPVKRKFFLSIPVAQKHETVSFLIFIRTLFCYLAFFRGGAFLFEWSENNHLSETRTTALEVSIH